MQKVSSSWEEVSQRVRLITDAIGNPIDEGIFDTVVALNVLGFTTVMSCEGHLERAIAAPWVDIMTPGGEEIQAQIRLAQKAVEPDQNGIKLYNDEAKTLSEQLKNKQRVLFQSLTQLLDQFYESRGHIPYDQRLIPCIWGKAAGRIRLEPIGTELQAIVSNEIKEKKLAAYQREMSDFTTFLKSHIE
ncbi:hypothetical protein ccbrp13_56490 [Ktedonobacteria bacterium brp13]|nr:hypothetical protein ccbrp13_56490 [Ktedonobacteria bacterium brp13]